MLYDVRRNSMIDMRWKAEDTARTEPQTEN